MQVHNVSKDKEVVVRLSPDELIKLCNVLYKAPDDEKNKLYYHLYSELMLARDLCQYGHIDDFSMGCIMEARNKYRNTNPASAEQNMTIGKKIKLARSLSGLTTKEFAEQNMTIGKKIKLARSLSGLTTKELGELIGLSNDRIRQYESDVRTPRKDKMKDFCDALDVSESFFVNHHMETKEDIIQLLFDLERRCSMEVIQIDEKNNTYGILFKDNIVNEGVKKWYEKRKLMKSGELSENDYALWQAKFSIKE